MAKSLSLGKWALIVIGIAVIAGIAALAISAIAIKRVETKSMNNAKTLGFACKMYATDHGGKYPPSLDDLIPTYLPNRSFLASPLAPDQPDGYIYNPGLTDTSPSDTILLKDKYSESRKHAQIAVRVDDSANVVAVP